MRSLRDSFAIVVILLLLGGYLASEFAYLNGNPQDYASRVDRQPIPLLALFVLLGSIALSFVKDRGGGV